MRSTAFKPRATASAGKRSKGRIELRLRAKLIGLANSQPAILENLSKTGAKLRVAAPLRIGSELVLQWHGSEALGKVSWSRGGQCGLTFAAPLGEPVLHQALALDAAERLPDEDDDRAAARAWVEGNARIGID
jgi:hypothetical protein